MKRLLLFLFIGTVILKCANAQTITGLVSGSDGEGGLPGVNVALKGASAGTVTNFDGNYTITISGEDPILVFSFIGYVSHEVKVSGRTKIDVTLNVATTGLDEIVVVGYGVEKKALVTGANINVKGEDIMELNTSSAMEALQGVTSGVSITRNSGAPGSGTKVTIRGLGTVGNSSPLYIVDGVAVGNIDYLNASDIETIDVLKDAASAAIYGSRAANGVILVTTRKGKKGTKTRVTYDAYYGFQNIYKKVPTLSAPEYMFITDEGRVNDNLAPNDWEFILKNNNWLNTEYPNDLGKQLGDDIWQRLQNGWEGTDWVDEMTKSDAPIQSHAINITGASESVVYSLGFSYFDQQGLIGGDIVDAGYKRLTARLNTEITIFEKDDLKILKVGENLTFNNIRNRSVATGNIYWNDLHNAIVQNPLMPSYWSKSPDRNGFTPNLDGLSYGQHNPLATMFYRHNYNWGKSNGITGNVFAELQPLKNLKFRSSFGLNTWFGHSRSWAPTYSLGVINANAVDAAQQGMHQGVDYTWTNTLTYDYRLNLHKISVLVGSEMLKNQLNTNLNGRKQNTNFGRSEYAYLDNVNKGTDVNSIDTWGRNWAAQGGGLMSYIGRLSYNYKEKYMVNATLRGDGSSNFAKGNRWGVFPSISVGWNISEEEFMEDFMFLDYAKVRSSWGQNGNNDIPNFIYSSNISYLAQGYFFGDTKPISGATAIPANVPNPDVSWETSEQLNFGMDARFLRERLSVTFDWYKKSTKDWLVKAPVLGTAGAGAPFVNGGDIVNQGFELMVGWRGQLGEFKYSTTISGAHNKNKVTKLANSEGVLLGPSDVLSQNTAYVSRVAVGMPIGYFYGFKADGILQNQNEVDAYVAPSGADNAGKPYFEGQRPGDVRFIDQNQDGKIDEEDKVMLGDPNPDLELGLQLNTEYKGFYASTTLTGKFGMQVMRSYRSFANSFDENYTTEIFERWHGAGTSSRLPRLSASSHRNTNYISDIYMHNADYLRISNLTIGYKFGRLLKRAKWIQDAKLYLAFNNLYTLTKYDGMDPEVGFGHDASWASGIDLGLYPLPRTTMLGVNLTF